MNPIEIKVKENNGIARNLEPIRVGIPFSKGAVKDVDSLSIWCENNSHIISTRTTTSYWPDRSVRWCIIEFPVSIPEQQQKTFAVKLTPPLDEVGVSYSKPKEHGDTLSIDTGIALFAICTTQLRPIYSVNILGTVPSLAKDFALTLVGEDGQTYLPLIESTNTSQPNNSFKQEILQTGHFTSSDGTVFCKFTSTLTFYANSSLVQWKLCIHNPNAATHCGGIWDLGDPGSIFFDSLALSIDHRDNAKARIQANEQSAWQECGAYSSIYQGSSGGKNWDSRNHINRFGTNPVTQHGYTYTTNNTSTSGDRANPILHSDSGVSVYLEHFWQNFPKAFTSDYRNLFVEFFPKCFEDTFELQGGEKKTHTTYFEFSNDKSALSWVRHPLIATLPPTYCASTDTAFHFSLFQQPVDKLIQQGVSEQNGFFAKNESVDEFGWRNFGDLFADHESLYLDNDEKFISHYNNQYDPLYGFICQYIFTNDPKWMELANNLAQHICDIDIYDTCQDRVEYNGGLFWHTDHYLDAFTASHRTYSHHQKGTLGGGPGGQHCYSRGLLLHYMATGSSSSKESLLKLERWITHFYEGGNTVVEKLYGWVSAENKTVIISNTSGGMLSFKYPLDRGTGNYINTLLDTYYLTGDLTYIDRAAKIIQNTVHPQENINDRNLTDIEETWFYTIFLQAVIRFLTAKLDTGNILDHDAQYAIQSYLLYVDWMHKNESPYLSNADKLEYPNDTWVAQDIRKACIFNFAATMDEEKKERYAKKAIYYYSYVHDTLEQSKTSHYTRILAILMQNHGGASIGVNDSPLKPAIPLQPELYKQNKQKITVPLFELLKRFLKLNPKSELKWLAHRSSLFAKLYSALFGNL